MTQWQELKELAKYPGTLLFSLTWAWETRKVNDKGFVDRMITAAEDAMEAL